MRPSLVTVGIAVIVGANAAISIAGARRGRLDRIPPGARFAALAAGNLAFVLAAGALLSDRADFQLGAGCFFALLITLIIWLYNVYKPVHDVRFDRSPAGALLVTACSSSGGGPKGNRSGVTRTPVVNLYG